MKTDEDPRCVTVFLNDYGIKDTVDSRDIRRKIMLEEIPAISMRCRIHDIRWLLTENGGLADKNSRVFSQNNGG